VIQTPSLGDNSGHSQEYAGGLPDCVLAGIESEGPSFPEIESILLHNWLVVTRGIVEMLYLDFTCNNQ